MSCIIYLGSVMGNSEPEDDPKNKTKTASISTEGSEYKNDNDMTRQVLFVVELHPHGIAPTWNCIHLFKNVLNLLVCIKFNFFLTTFLSLSDLFP